MTTPQEVKFVMQNSPDNVGFLLDVAHLKVTSATLSYNPIIMFEECSQWIRAYHLSDNDGTSDSNDPVQDDSWFWPHIEKGKLFYSLEIKNISPKNMLSQVKLVSEKLASKTV